MNRFRRHVLLHFAAVACAGLCGGLLPGQDPKPDPNPNPNPQPPSLSRFLDVQSKDFRFLIDAEQAQTRFRKRYEVVLRRGPDRFDVLLFREVNR